MLKDSIFEDFHEYWYYARYLSEEQRTIIYNSLPSEQRKHLNLSYKKGSWSDVFYRNEIDDFLDEMKDRYGYDVLELRAKALTGKSVYIPTKFWEIVLEHMNQYNRRNVKYITSGIKDIQCKNNPNVTLLVSEKSDSFDINE
jgi:hypothetical protein